MSNQAISWSMLFLPWLTLFFMNKEEIKRFMPVALFSALTSVIAVETGESLGWFIYGETTYPLRTSSYIIFGLNCVTTIWLFHFVYGNFLRYIMIDLLLNFGFIYLFHVYFLGSRGIFHEVGITPFVNALITTTDGALVYAYQMWQEGIFVRYERTEKTKGLRILQSEAAKPLVQDRNENSSQDKDE